MHYNMTKVPTFMGRHFSNLKLKSNTNEQKI